jgi:hypothetical protein
VVSVTDPYGRILIFLDRHSHITLVFLSTSFLKLYTRKLDSLISEFGVDCSTGVCAFDVPTKYTYNVSLKTGWSLKARTDVLPQCNAVSLKLTFCTLA